MPNQQLRMPTYPRDTRNRAGKKTNGYQTMLNQLSYLSSNNFYVAHALGCLLAFETKVLENLKLKNTLLKKAMRKY